MQRFKTMAIAVGVMAVASMTFAASDAGWTTLVDGAKGLENFTAVGDANWSAKDGAIQADKGTGNAYLVTKQPYKDFAIRAEFWVSEDANSGIFIRCKTATPDADTCYEVNVFDKRPDPSYGTGAIVNVAKAPTPAPKAGGKWNTYEITAKGSHLTLVLNGVKTVDVEDSKLANGPFALQWGAGTVKFRKVQVKSL